MGINFAIIAGGLTVSNFIYQAIISTPDYGRAFDLSFFQVLAVVICYFTVRAHR